MIKKLLDITELSLLLDLKDKKTGKATNHILRYWEQEFSQIKPIILKGNRRYYNQNQVEKIKYIKYLLKDKGMTIKGVKKYLQTKKDIDVDPANHIEEEYIKSKITTKSKKILEKIKKIKNYG